MKISQIRYFIILAPLIAGLVQCKKEEIARTPPVAAFTLTPASGLTTTVFQFDATGSKATNAGDTMLFIRWDWDNDNIWDTGFSRAKKFTHRYYKPGSYIPRMEIRNEAGLSDTIQSPVQVGRGYSAPQPRFSLSAINGNLRTEFVVDAGKTTDDEDSLNTLKLRWDWNGDGNYDTGYSELTLASHIYPDPGTYNIVLEVVDPMGLSATLSKSVTVTVDNPNLVPRFTYTPERPTTSDTVLFDASSSYDPENPGNTFTYRWNFTKDDVFDTESLTNPVIGHQFPDEGETEVVLEITDQWGLVNQTKVKIFIAHSNLRPTASFIVGHDYGNLTTTFYFDAAGTRDGEDFIDQIKVRWDFESDGVWDTEFAKEKVANHKYGNPGKYHVRLEVIDSGGLTDTTGLNVSVSEGTNETGIIIDKNNSQYYGTVKIGTQWWMSENLNEASTNKCYGDKPSNCRIYGGLYTWSAAMNLAITEKSRGLCPQGWHVPSAGEWQQLIDFYGADMAKKKLEVTGDSDFRMLLAGQLSTSGSSEYLNSVANFWTSTKIGDNATSFEFLKDSDTYQKLTLAQTYAFSVRCLKD